MTKIIYPLLVLLLVLMVYFGVHSYKHAVDYEYQTTELVSHQGAQEQAKRQLSKLAKSILGNLYEDTDKATLDAIKAQQEYAMKEAKHMMYFFMLVLLFILLSYFFIPLRSFTIIASLAAIITLIFGLLTPILMVTIHKEVEYLGDIVLSFESKGIIGSIIKLWDGGDVVVALVILLFSVIVPIVKILSLLFVSVFIESKFAHSVVKFFKMIGKWSMVDVFVVAVFLVYLTANKGDVSRAEVEVGLYFFLAYVIVSMLVSLSADRMLHTLKA
ncbi:MAG TPA: paraquat-inducible protein A [Epsilonproteobacteria bacterium]|nr:paraquat-inducible protein A [Campylobacterota bacterium]